LGGGGGGKDLIVIAFFLHIYFVKIGGFLLSPTLW